MPSAIACRRIVLDRLALLDEPLDRVGADQQLVQAHAALVAAAAALGAALRAVQPELGRVADAQPVPVLEPVALA